MKRRRKTHKRGRTRTGRLSLVDRLLSTRSIPLRPRIDTGGARQLDVLDVGFGDSITTTVELGRTLLELSDEVTCTGVEVDELRVNNAREELTQLSEGLLPELGIPRQLEIRACSGKIRFDEISTAEELVFAALEVKRVQNPHHLIRCCNVLRGYGKAQALAARSALLSHLDEGGVLLEGTTDAGGHLAALDWWDRPQAQPRHRGLILTTDFSRGFAPMMFRDLLPRFLRRDCLPGTEVFQLLQTWQEQVDCMRASASSLPELFASSLALCDEGRLLWFSNEGAAAHFPLAESTRGAARQDR